MRKFNIILFSEVNSKFGMPFFKRLYNCGHFNIKAFVTTPEGQLCSYYIGESDPVDLEKYAKEHDIPVYRPRNIKSADFIFEMSKYNPDYILIANYQKIFSQELIDLPKYLTLNFHPSPLPRYAGLNPFFWMARNDEKNSGVSCIALSPKIDGGKIVKQLPVKLSGNETTREVRDILFSKSLTLLDKVINDIVENKISVKDQDLKKRKYYSNPTEKDMTLTNDMDIEEAIHILNACFPNGAIANINGKNLRVNRSNSNNGIKFDLKDGKVLLDEVNKA